MIAGNSLPNVRLRVFKTGNNVRRTRNPRDLRRSNLESKIFTNCPDQLQFVKDYILVSNYYDIRSFQSRMKSNCCFNESICSLYDEVINTRIQGSSADLFNMTSVYVALPFLDDRNAVGESYRKVLAHQRIPGISNEHHFFAASKNLRFFHYARIVPKPKIHNSW